MLIPPGSGQSDYGQYGQGDYGQYGSGQGDYGDYGGMFPCLSLAYSRPGSEAAISTADSPPGSGNAEAQCENQGLTAEQCMAVGCCEFEEGQVSLVYAVFTLVSTEQVFAKC